MVRFFLVEKELKVKHSDTLGRMQSRVSNLNKRTWEGRAVLKQMKVRRDDMKVFAKGVVSRGSPKLSRGYGGYCISTYG